jgi:uncharacterized protein (DUF983 family)
MRTPDPARLERLERAIAAVARAVGGRRGIRGALLCPACGEGTLYYASSEVNGHTRAECDAPGCVCWVE